MESIDTTNTCFTDNLPDFSFDISKEEDDDSIIAKPKLVNYQHSNHCLFSNHYNINHHILISFLPELVEEELEWISNKDAFPMVESLVDIMPNHPSITTSNNNSSLNESYDNNSSHHHNHQSPVSVLEDSSNNNGVIIHRSGNNNNNNMMLVDFKVPGKARSKVGRKRRRDLLGQQFFCWPNKKHGPISRSSGIGGRKCLHCGVDKTPQWRAGPLGPKTLCNACGVRYKSGRLCDEYRPANSPTFCSELHSNSHRKIVEMRNLAVR